MKEQVLSIEQMRELESLGIDTSKASMCWGKWNDEIEWYLFSETKAERDEFVKKYVEGEEYYNGHETIPTFTFLDIMQMLPHYIEEDTIGRFDYELRVKKDEVVYESYDAFDKNGEPFFLDFFSIGYDGCETIMDCMFEMLKSIKMRNLLKDGE